MRIEKETSMIRVLLADDHAVVRAGIRQFLERAGDLEIVAEAKTGKEACELIDQQKIDVVVLDIQMPEMSGIEAARWVRKNHPAIGVLILTAYDDEPYVQAVMRTGANGYVLKTASPDEIIQAVRDVNEGRSVLDRTLTDRLVSRMRGEGFTDEFTPMTNREVEVLTLVGKGYTNKAIGMALSISDRTVQNHMAKIFGKLHASSRTEAVMRAISLGWISSDLVG